MSAFHPERTPGGRAENHRLAAWFSVAWDLQRLTGGIVKCFVFHLVYDRLEKSSAESGYGAGG
jgi:hypothetical protein